MQVVFRIMLPASFRVGLLRPQLVEYSLTLNFQSLIVLILKYGLYYILYTDITIRFSMVISFVRRTAFARSVLDTLRCTQPVSKTKFCFILKTVLFKIT